MGSPALAVGPPSVPTLRVASPPLRPPTIAVGQRQSCGRQPPPSHRGTFLTDTGCQQLRAVIIALVVVVVGLFDVMGPATDCALHGSPRACVIKAQAARRASIQTAPGGGALLQSLRLQSRAAVAVRHRSSNPTCERGGHDASLCSASVRPGRFLGAAFAVGQQARVRRTPRDVTYPNRPKPISRSASWMEWTVLFGSMIAAVPSPLA